MIGIWITGDTLLLKAISGIVENLAIYSMNMIVFLMMTALWMMTATISWVMATISRSVQISSTISCETPIYVILYVLRDVRTLFIYYF